MFLLSLPLWFSACRDAKVATYRIPKEIDPPAAVAAPAGLPGAGNMAGPAVTSAEGNGLEWTAPAQWKPKTGSALRKGSYAIGDEGGPVADFAITAFPGNVGGDLANVNRWRGQLQLAPIPEAELGQALTPVTANGLAMQVVDLAGGTPDNPQRMLGAIVPHAGSTWFFKLTGPDALVAKVKPDYLAFLQTVKVSALAATPASPPPAADMANTPVIKAEGAGLKWTAPVNWQEKPATAMRKATYVVPGAGGASADFAVTAFPGDVGGELANVNRWRGQLQLPPLAESGLAGAVSRQMVNGLAVTLVDFTGGAADQPQRMLGALVPHAGATWFFKLTGPAALVADEKPAFLALVQSLQAP